MRGGISAESAGLSHSGPGPGGKSASHALPSSFHVSTVGVRLVPADGIQDQGSSGSCCVTILLRLGDR